MAWSDCTDRLTDSHNGLSLWHNYSLGNLKYSYDEQVGTEFEMDKIIDAVKLASAETMAPPEAATQEL